MEVVEGGIREGTGDVGRQVLVALRIKTGGMKGKKENYGLQRNV